MNQFSLDRIDCSENCKMRKQMLEIECKQLRRDMSSIEELKKSAEQQSRNYEQEVKICCLSMTRKLFSNKYIQFNLKCVIVIAVTEI